MSKKIEDEKLASLKKTHGDLVRIKFKVNGQSLSAVLRQPTLAELDATISSLPIAPISSSVGLFKTCFLDGDKELLDICETNSGLAIAINKEIQKIIPNVSSESTNV